MNCIRNLYLHHPSDSQKYPLYSRKVVATQNLHTPRPQIRPSTSVISLANFSLINLGEGHKRSQFAHPATSEFVLSTKQVDLAHMVATVKGPSGSAEPVLLKKSSDGRLGELEILLHLRRSTPYCLLLLAALACFQPKVRGKYVVNVTAEGSPIQGSPFKIDVRDDQLCKAVQVKVSGQGKADAEANIWNDICIDVSGAGELRVRRRSRTSLT